ncbi:MAG: deoxyribose-phosphate aldolase [Deltaproteobacteria bacterium]
MEEVINAEAVAKKIDHAVLNPADGSKEIIEACKMAIEQGIASVCVKPSYVKLTAGQLKGSSILVCTVIGFPHGGTTTDVKLAEAQEAINNGANEIDMVINIAKLKEQEDEYVKEEIRLLAEVVHKSNAVLKVIMETALLDHNEKVKVCKFCEEAGADYVKTSTGFANGGAEIEDIKLFKAILGDRVKIKASGGIKSLEQAKDFIREGCSRLGTSKTVQILSSIETDDGY